jgi:hypothetical protein
METNPLRTDFTAGIRGSFLAFLGISGSSPTTKMPSGNHQGTFRGHSGDIQGTFREHSGNIQGTFSVS